MEQQQPQFDFLYTKVQHILDENGFENLSEELRDQYLPQLVAEAERRLGAAVLPKLDEAGATKLVALIKDQNTTAEMMQTFFDEHVDGYKELVEQTLTDFAGEVKEIVSTL